ncbi:MAG: anthranilate synthase component I family protein [Phycisphaeraceae bacterium]|nr:anthranilate synthase component I family protein [Phycisphaeraceae bacterium]
MTTDRDGNELERIQVPDPWTWLRQRLQTNRTLIGYLGYGLGHHAESVQPRVQPDRPWPPAILAECRQVRYFRPPAALSDADREPRGADRPVMSSRFVDALPRLEEWQVSLDDEAFAAAVERAKAYIAAGDIYQVNLTRRWSTRFAVRGSVFPATRELYAHLVRGSPAWYGGYLEFPARLNIRTMGHSAIASVSPELFLQLDPDGLVTTRPIKGTRPADRPATELRNSLKDEAELNMIVDLLRNDLGRVAQPASVQVVEARAIESHPTIRHGVATVQARLARGRDRVDLLRAAFPGGSITGAPKIRAMQIIEELEPVPRGPYCGSLAIFTPDGGMKLNIAIRTLMLHEVPSDTARDQRGGDTPTRRLIADYHAGCGIVADSNPEEEVAESLAKARVIERMLGGD